ncbi:putative mariner transposase [Trichonephila clavipes]|uniref:Putative mariner transposase n=1 Tax=Trichonephila clavipes TaxID=2585209 RepID=A0A8X6W9R3_TRICX|nr:putative mariner transposase [Trichonephila clavipes]
MELYTAEKNVVSASDLDWWCRAGRGNAVKTRRVEQAVVSRPLPKNYSSRSYESSLDGAAAECTKSTVEKWFAKFKRVEMSTEDDARSERPKEAVTDENIKKVHKIIFDNRKVKFIEIAETLKISKEHVGHIVNEYLDMRKLCSKWVRASSQSRPQTTTNR